MVTQPAMGAQAVTPAVVERERMYRRLLAGATVILLGFSFGPILGHHLPNPVSAALVGRDHLWSLCMVALHALAAPVHRAFHLLSDFNLLTTSMLPHGVSVWQKFMQVASLDHALWFHANLRMDDWLLYAMDSPWAGNARGFSRGSIYNRAGQLVASVAQEGLVRLREDWK